MNELINLVSQKTGISVAQATEAVHTVIGFVKEKLPAPIALQIDSLVGNNPTGMAPEESHRGVGGIAGDALKGIEGALGL